MVRAFDGCRRAVWPHGFDSVGDDRDAGNDDRRAGHERAHDVSHRNGGVRRLERLQLCRKRSTMRMTPPQSGQAGTSARVWRAESKGDGSALFGAGDMRKALSEAKSQG